jgi:predicted transcriptional regulator
MATSETVAALDPDEVERLYHEKGLSQKEVGERFGVSQAAVHYFMSERGIDARPRSEPAADPEEVERLYHDEGLSQREIADRFGVTRSAIGSLMRRHGIPTRSTTHEVERETLLKDVRGLWRSTDGHPSTYDYEEVGVYSKGSPYKFFDEWAGVIVEACGGDQPW